MVAGEWEYDLAGRPWQSHSGFCAESWGCKGTETGINVQACGKGHPPKVRGQRRGLQPPCFHGHSSHSGCACRASLPFLPIMLAYITHVPSDSACHPVPFQYKAFLLKSAASVSAACRLEAFRMERASSKLTTGGPWRGEGEIGLATCDILLIKDRVQAPTWQ